MTVDPSDSRVLQRVVLPTDDDLDVVPLYVETEPDRGAELASDARAGAPRAALAGRGQSAVQFTATGSPGPARRRAVVAPGRRVSFGTYFNAFPASYWRRWSRLQSVRLRLRIAGDAAVTVYRSTATGDSHAVRTVRVENDQPESVEMMLPLDRFIDGGWYWFDVVAGARPARLEEADWTGEADGRPRGRLSIGITTFNRPQFLLDLLRTIGASDDVLDILDTVYVVDQGSERVAAHPDFADATKALRTKLTLIEQANLGGSGGFARAMAETLRADISRHLLLLDDDVVVEPESILRAATFADLARRPTIVGGHMFNLHARAVLHAFGETIAPRKWWWGPAPNTEPAHDFGRRGLRHTPWLHRRVDVDYNGWWMCLIPTSVIRHVGLALPMFIKWDDAEYGVRAQRQGYPTVSLPGVAVWHMPWQDKNDALDWQAYFHLRNRLISALLHSPFESGARVVAASAETQVQHLLAMQYSTAAVRLRAITDVLAGPDRLHETLPTMLGTLRELRGEFQDARSAADVEDFPQIRRRKPPRRDVRAPRNAAHLVLAAGLAGVRQLVPPSDGGVPRPLASLSHQDADWWQVSTLDSVLVSAADGATTAWYRRDPKAFAQLSRRSAVLHARLLARWSELRVQYRNAAIELSSPDRWWLTFSGDTVQQQ